MAITREQFVEALGQSGLMTSTEAAAFQETQDCADAPTLAAELVRHNKLTPFQAEMLISGRAPKLVYGEYSVLDKLGEGGMGVVYKTQHKRLQRWAALKVLHPSVTKSDDAVKRFHREVEAAARLAHPNIVAAYDANEQDGTHYFVMEYIDGTDLFRLVKENGPLPVHQAVDYLAQAARGLEHAHNKGVIHRDIKPSNLLIERRVSNADCRPDDKSSSFGSRQSAFGTLKILDMGLVRFTDSTSAEGDRTGSEHLTQTGEILGSFDYMAPEQAIDTKRVDHRADIYGLGCTLHYLLTGRAPYRGDTTMQKLLAHRESAIPSLRKLRPDVPLALDAVFQRMLAKKPEDRYASMAEVIDDLAACRIHLEKTVDSSPSMRGNAADRGLYSVPVNLILAGTVCILAVLTFNFVLAYQAYANRWAVADEVLFVKWYTLFAGLGLLTGIGMVAIGIVVSALGAVGERLLGGTRRLPLVKGGQGGVRDRRTRLVARWLLGVLAGLVVGAIGGAVLGVGLALHPSDEVRTIGGIATGVFVGGALAGLRAWHVILGGAFAGFFVGTTVGKHSFVFNHFGVVFLLNQHDLPAVGFGLVGAVVGAVLGGRLSNSNAAAKRASADTRPIVVTGLDDVDDHHLATHETVRRAPKSQ